MAPSPLSLPTGVPFPLSMLMDRRKEMEDMFVKNFGVPLESEVLLPTMIGAFGVMAQCSLNVEGVGFVKSWPPTQSYRS